MLAHLFQLLIPLSEAGISMWLIIRKVDLHSFAQFLTQNSLLIQDFSFLNRTSALVHSTLSWTRTCSMELLCILNLNSVFNYLVLVSIPLTYYRCNWFFFSLVDIYNMRFSELALILRKKNHKTATNIFRWSLGHKKSTIMLKVIKIEPNFLFYRLWFIFLCQIAKVI